MVAVAIVMQAAAPAALAVAPATELAESVATFATKNVLNCRMISLCFMQVLTAAIAASAATI